MVIVVLSSWQEHGWPIVEFASSAKAPFLNGSILGIHNEIEDKVQ